MMMRSVLLAGMTLVAGLAVALDASRPDAALLIAQCAAGDPLLAAWRSVGLAHLVAFPFTTACMALLCVPVAEHRGPRRAAWRHAARRLLAVAASALPACVAGAFMASALGTGAPAFFASFAYGATMLAVCVALPPLLAWLFSGPVSRLIAWLGSALRASHFVSHRFPRSL